MSDLTNQINYARLFRYHGMICIPMIQRDYAQGRVAQKEVREQFLSALESALKKAPDDPSLPLNLDFIYGCIEGGGNGFQPLDGQQRLTTLFLLHWYLAWVEGAWEDFSATFMVDSYSRFSYSVRPSSKDFFDEFVAFRPAERPGDVSHVSRLIKDQPWYFRSWRFDPTVQAALGMLDAMHGRFVGSSGLYARLTDDVEPAITFQLLDLENFGLSDDLYIKMNARGKLLTAFETFKARYETFLADRSGEQSLQISTEGLSPSEFIARRMDTRWADLFWAYRDPKTNLYDDAYMKVICVIALITRDPANQSFTDDIAELRKARVPSFSTFEERGWLDRNFTETLVSLLEAWSSHSDGMRAMLPDSRYFDELSFFKKVSAGSASILYAELVQFAAYAAFVRISNFDRDARTFQEWMRIVVNLSVNTSYDRVGDIQRSIAGLLHLVEHSGDILRFFASTAKPVSGFSELQVQEEQFKAQLILSDDGWRPLIDEAEAHGYFSGQIGFLLEFCGAKDKRNCQEATDWDRETHLALQARFRSYLQKAQLMFKRDGLCDLGEFRWERALLAVGDYLMPSGRNFSFLSNAVTEQASWKRLLRGSGSKGAEARAILNQLFDMLTDDVPIEEQLDCIIEDARPEDVARSAFIRHPQAIEYCTQRAIRRENEAVYLLAKKQMNGLHAELFTFCLHHSLESVSRDGSFAPLRLEPYQELRGAESEPGIELVWPETNQSVYIEASGLSYDIYTEADPDPDPDTNEIAQEAFFEILSEQGFCRDEEDWLCLNVELDEEKVFDVLRRLSQSLKSVVVGQE